MGEKITRPANSAEVSRAKHLKEALHRGVPTLSRTGDPVLPWTIPQSKEPISKSWSSARPRPSAFSTISIVLCALMASSPVCLASLPKKRSADALIH